METMIVLGFYKYVSVKNPEELRERIKEFCDARKMKGRILLGAEGINGSVSGTPEQTGAFRTFLSSEEQFTDIFFKKESSLGHPFKKMKVLVRPEIVAFGKDIDITKTGRLLTSDEFLALYDATGNLRDEVVVLDARNNYEYRVGKFKNAIHLDIRTFKGFPKASQKIAHLKDKKVVMYCTGGIRCEKASAYLKEQGFSDVSQLHMGIINFGAEQPNTVWEGKCFVFDKRLLSSMKEADAETLTNCDLCGTECDHLRNCRTCNEFIVACPECDMQWRGCCSTECLNGYKDWVRKQQQKIVPKVVETERFL